MRKVKKKSVVRNRLIKTKNADFHKGWGNGEVKGIKRYKL